jgi:predicted signal transduction protein with EAL and GGDEF domain
MGGFIPYFTIAPVIASSGLPTGLSPAIVLANEAPCIAPLCSLLRATPDFERSFEALAQPLVLGVSGAISGGDSAPSALFLSGAGVILAIVTAAILVLAALLYRGAGRQNILRQERDAALQKIETLETLSERDPLTGLLNRHVVEERSAKLRSEGFDTFALIDLDKFKTVNDRYGHQVGDEVLVACGEVLKGDEERDYLAMRLGGEEFVVLLRGVDPFSGCSRSEMP